MDAVRFRFEHGLGDVANFCRLLQLYRQRGHQVEVASTPDKRPLFELAGATAVDAADVIHPWSYPPDGLHHGPCRHWQGHKVAGNLSRLPLPVIGTPAELWDELVRPVDLTGGLWEACRDRARNQLSGLPRPVVLFHAIGNTDRVRKSLSPELQRAVYLEWVERSAGTLVLLDWDRRVEVLRHPRIVTLDALGGAGTLGLLALIAEADVLAGVDSGPLHLAGLTSTPAVGLWSPGHHPARYLLPRPGTVNLVPVPEFRELNQWKRAAFRILDWQGSAAEVVGAALELAGPRRYCPGAGDDLLVAWAIRRFGRVHLKEGECGGVVDRAVSFDHVLRHLAAGEAHPIIVETGTVRRPEDVGAGWSTWLWGAFCRGRGGQVISIDLSAENCRLAREWTGDFGVHCEIREGRGADELRKLRRQAEGSIDLLYLDSCDTDDPAHQQTALEEFQAAEPLLHPDSLVLIDDSPAECGGPVTGKGAELVPYLCDRGWRPVYRGYQVLLARSRVMRLTAAPPADRVAFRADDVPVVYTVLTGDGRDVLQELPAEVTGGRVRFVCLSDRPREAAGWEVRVVEPVFRDPRLESRRLKWLPQRFFPEAEWWLYLDASVRLLRHPVDLAAVFSRTGWWAFRHPERDCLFAEGLAVRSLAMADRETVTGQLAFYRGAGMPEHWGLAAGGCLWRENTGDVVRVSEDVWREIALWNQPRDQVALPYAAWRNGCRWREIPGGIHEVDWLELRPHDAPRPSPAAV